MLIGEVVSAAEWVIHAALPQLVTCTHQLLQATWKQYHEYTRSNRYKTEGKNMATSRKKTLAVKSHPVDEVKWRDCVIRTYNINN